MKRNLVIGNTSQLSYYFPEEYVKMSSRNIDESFIRGERWNRAYLCFGESRKFIGDSGIHDDINFNMTIRAVDTLLEHSEKIIVYSTCELWNKYDGKIDLSMEYSFYDSPYLQSKYRLSKHISDFDRYGKVIIMYPFNFNSIHRSTDFLFGKIFDSIINKRKIEIGDTYFYRDIIHPKHVVKESIESNSNKIIGSGRLTFVNDYIRDLYSHYDMDYREFVSESSGKYNEYEKRKEYYLNSEKCQYSYKQLLSDTIEEINLRKK